MILEDRPFSNTGADFESMWRLVQRDTEVRGDQHIWTVGRLADWKFGLWNEQKYFPTFFPRYAHLWTDGMGRLSGFVLSENGDEEFCILTQPESADLYPLILDWTVTHWYERAQRLGIEVHEGQTEAMRCLEERGFRRDPQTVHAVTHIYDLTEPALQAPPRLPAGYQIVDMLHATPADFTAKRALQVEAFRNQAEPLAVDLLSYEYSREAPTYDAAADLSVVAPDGRHAAACMAFMDPLLRLAEVERVCTGSDFRRMGLGEAVIRACFQRLAQRGILRAYITGYSPAAKGLYARLGPCARKLWYYYSL